MKNTIKASLGYMTFSAVLTIILGLILLFYPGGTLLLMSGAYWAFQFILSIFILYYCLTETYVYFKIGQSITAFGYFFIGILAAVLIWLTSLGLIYYLVAFFLFLSGLVEISSGFRLGQGDLILAFLGVINIFIGLLVLTNVFFLPVLIAWYVLFWGVSRLLFSLELRRLLAK